MSSTASQSRGWVTVLAGLGINLALGVLYTWSVVTATLTKTFQVGADGMLVPAAEAGKYINITGKAADGTAILGKGAALKAAVVAEGAYNWTALDALIPYALCLLSFATMMAFAGRIQDKYGPRLVATVGGAIVGSGMILASFTDMSAKGNHLPIIMGFGILTGCGIGLAYACATPAAVKWFHPSQKGLITGLVVAGFGLSSVYTAPLTTYLIGQNGVQGMFRILGIAFTISICGLAQLLKNPPEGYVCPVPAKAAKAAAAATTKPTVAREYSWRETVKTPQFWTLWVMYAFVSFAGLMMIGIVSKVATDYFGPAGTVSTDPTFATWSIFGLGLGKAFWFTVALALGNGLGRPVAGFVSDAIGRTRTMMLVFLSQAVLVGWAVGAASSLPMLLAVAFGIGFMFGSNLTLFPATTFDYFGLKNGGANYGIVFTAWGVGGALGSYFSGFAKTMWGSFGPAYTLAAALCVLAAGLALWIKAPKTAKASAAEAVAAEA
jgi:OFA family oxalate/formate antiporter-like MFS transporter